MRRFFQMLGIALWWLMWPGMWLILNNTVRTRLVFRNERGEVLVIRNWLTSNTRWSMPGGGVHKGEKLLDGLLREVHEEIGITIAGKMVRKLGLTTIRNKGIITHLHCYTAVIKREPTLRLRRFEVSEACWMDPSALTLENSRPDAVAALELLNSLRPANT